MGITKQLVTSLSAHVYKPEGILPRIDIFYSRAHTYLSPFESQLKEQGRAEGESVREGSWAYRLYRNLRNRV